MSTNYITAKAITMDELFDGRLESYGIHERVVEGKTAKGRRLLTDGSNSLWIYGDTVIDVATRYGLANFPGQILDAIGESFDTIIYSEHEPQYWGFETVEEWERVWDEMHKQKRAETYLEIMNYVNGLPTNIEPGTAAMSWAEIAQELIAESPTLLSPDHQEELMQEICDRYYGIDVGAC